MTLHYAAEAFVTVEQVRDDASCGCITRTDPDDATIEAIIDEVSDDFARVTGMRVYGRQNVVARPCRTADVDCCPCCGLDSIPLGDSDPTVTVVKIDGVTLGASEWWVHRNRHSWVISRKPTGTQLSAPRWPSWQQRWRDDTEDNTFAIYFTQGIAIDSVVLREAALEAICDRATEHLKPQTRSLDGVTQMTIGGTTAVVDGDRLERIRSGQLGPKTTRMMGILAPDGRKTAQVWAPELTMGWDLNLDVAP